MRKKMLGAAILGTAVVATLVDFGVLPAAILLGDTTHPAKPSCPWTSTEVAAPQAVVRLVAQTEHHLKPPERPAPTPAVRVQPASGFPVVDPAPLRATAPTGKREASSPLWAMRQAVVDLEKRQASLKKQQAELDAERQHLRRGLEELLQRVGQEVAPRPAPPAGLR